MNYSVFYYMYRDAGNWKTFGALLLTGTNDGARDLMRRCCESDGLFVAEQVGIPSLCPEHFAACGDGPSELDHAYHEFVDLRAASAAEIAAMSVFCTLDELLDRLRAATGRRDVTKSPYCACDGV
jgi:hypothetical protein